MVEKTIEICFSLNIGITIQIMSVDQVVSETETETSMTRISCLCAFPEKLNPSKLLCGTCLKYDIPAQLDFSMNQKCHQTLHLITKHHYFFSGTYSYNCNTSLLVIGETE